MVTADKRVTQLLAGRAYVRAQLAATAHDLAMHPLQQALQGSVSTTPPPSHDSTRCSRSRPCERCSDRGW